MRGNINFTVFHNAIYKFRNDLSLNLEEKRALLNALEETIGDFIPTAEELLIQKERIARLDNIDGKRDPEAFNALLEQCKGYEDKYLN